MYDDAQGAEPRNVGHAGTVYKVAPATQECTRYPDSQQADVLNTNNTTLYGTGG